MNLIITVEDIARQCHETNKAWCESIGDTSQSSWDESLEWQRESVIKGVLFHLENPDALPSDSHESWMKEKKEQGWTYGEVKDPIAKTHPAYLPYFKLPPEQRMKDYLFKGIVDAMRGFLLPN